MRTIKSTTWFDENLTEDNANFMRQAVAKDFKQMLADKLNPLKDEPWPRHEWQEGNVMATDADLVEYSISSFSKL